MARSHHRKKHKEHLRQFKDKEANSAITGKSNAASIFAIVGGIAGLAISYIAADGSIIWMIAGLLVGGIAGYFIGRSVDRNK
ncbi:MAG TPA: hypothetical protein VF487_12735 [Chitinophagaceae bacterium]